MNAAIDSKTKGTTRGYVPVLLLAAAFLAGCGTDVTTGPVVLSPNSVDSEVGELVLPDAGSAISAPRNLSAEYSAPGTMVVTWAAPHEGYEAIILRNGAEVGRVSARDGSFSDTLPVRAPGVVEYSYSVCFGRGTQLGPETFVVGVLPRQDNSGPGTTMSDEH